MLRNASPKLVYSMLLSLAFLPLGRATAANITAIWANSGEDKVTRDELRATRKTGKVLNRVWDGKTIRVFGGRNEVVAFNVILEAANNAASNIIISLNSLSGPGGSISSSPASSNGVF